jgi:hypothetical protein
MIEALLNTHPSCPGCCLCRIVRLGVSVATVGHIPDQPKIVDAALLQNVFETERNPCRLVCGVPSLPLGRPFELEVIFEVAG